VEVADYLSMTQPYAAGALGASLEDMLRWDAALRNNEMIPAETLQRMHNPATLADGTPVDYGLGWGIGAYAGRSMIVHAGGINGFATQQLHLPEDDLTIVLLSNWETVDVIRLSARIARQMLGLPKVTHRPFFLGEAALAKCTGTWQDQHGKIELWAADGGQITMVLPNREQRLLASSRHQLYVVDDPEITLDFADDEDDRFNRLTIHFPFSTRQLARAQQPPIMA
jgi:CubicO group peptidase (beta-lactamase class C family)